MIRVLVCGDRKWTDKAMIRIVLRRLIPPVTIIHGAARGADTLAGEVAYELGFTVERYPADWTKYGRAAGPIRNKEMLTHGRPDYVIGFHDDLRHSRGTADMKRQAERAGKQFEHYFHA